jgi:hypothetical protein
MESTARLVLVAEESAEVAVLVVLVGLSCHINSINNSSKCRGEMEVVDIVAMTEEGIVEDRDMIEVVDTLIEVEDMSGEMIEDHRLAEKELVMGDDRIHFTSRSDMVV